MKVKLNAAECIIVMIVIAGLVGSFAWSLKKISEADESRDGAVMDSEIGKEAYTFDDLLDAIEWVESKGDPWAVGDGGDAVGAYQIHKIFVDDVNRLAKSRIGYFSYTDRSDRNKSRKMATIYLKHYGGTFQEMARKFNGGPQGHKKESTKPYWEKVKARMKTVKVYE